MSDRLATIQLDGLKVISEQTTVSAAPWAERGPVFEYLVQVFADEGYYECPAWGSLHDYENEKREPEAMGYMVLGELLSAAYDPDEFFQMATEGEGGRARAQQILALISSAETLLPALERNEKAIQAYEEGEQQS